MPMHDEKYKAALESHKHYDNISITSVAGMFAVTYGCYSLHKNLNDIIYTEYIFVMGVLAIIALYFLYYKLSTFALIARHVHQKLERQDGLGVSEVYYLYTQSDEESKKKFKPYAVRQLSGLSFSIRCLVALIALGQIIALLVTAFF